MILAALALAVAEPPTLPMIGECIDVRDPAARLGFAGRLTLRSFPGAPNYESIAAGDDEERTFILQVDRPICIDDGGEFADPAERFDLIHVWGSPEVMAALRNGLGQYVQVFGRSFPSHTGHHHAPLVMNVDQVIVFEGWRDN